MIDGQAALDTSDPNLSDEEHQKRNQRATREKEEAIQQVTGKANSCAAVALYDQGLCLKALTATDEDLKWKREFSTDVTTHKPESDWLGAASGYIHDLIDRLNARARK
jgi:hypothetical protein